ncbi:MAG: hypothetical protein ACLPKE_23985, partial [Streptosporangiaceae bacterium]
MRAGACVRAGCSWRGLASLNAAIFALPRHCQGRQRTSGRTTAGPCRIRHTEEVTYTIEITESNSPKWDTTPE